MAWSIAPGSWPDGPSDRCPRRRAGEEDSQPRIADRLDQRTGEALRAEHLDIAGMKAARRRVDGLSQSKPVRGGGEVTGRRAQCRFAFPPRRRTESRACPSPATPRPLLPVALNVKLAQCERCLGRQARQLHDRAGPEAVATRPEAGRDPAAWPHPDALARSPRGQDIAGPAAGAHPAPSDRYRMGDSAGDGQIDSTRMSARSSVAV